MSITACACGKPIEQRATGRKRLSCSPECEAARLQKKRSVKCLWKDCDVMILHKRGKPNRFCCAEHKKLHDQSLVDLATPTHCACGAALEQPDRGRKRMYCSDECRRNAEKTKRYGIVCKRKGCKTKVIRGRRGRQGEFCSERCKRLYYYWETTKPIVKRYIEEMDEL